MARWFDPSEEQARTWQSWVEQQPEAARAALGEIEPWDLYVQPSTGVIVTLHGLKPEADGVFSLFVNLIGHVEHEFTSPYYGARVADPSSLKHYDPVSTDEMAALARRAAGGGERGH